ncbi:MAG: serine/threonine-protein phosphatase [Lachnospiraceae bacterium]|nr:serine/threonine-protein phosphatase [Lachnospiraceae bacterium]
MQDNLLMKIIQNSYIDVLVCSYLGDRTEQQDAVYASLLQDRAFAVVADGMGGLENGKCASNTAVRVLKNLFDENATKDNMQGFYYNSIRTIDKAVYETRAEGNKSGTTIVSATITGDRMDWLSVGDSRLYRVHGGAMEQLTKDHTLYNYIEQNKDNPEIIASLGEIDESKLDALTSYIGMGGVTFYDINTAMYKIKSGDYILLTSDGLYKAVSDDEILKVINENAEVQAIGEKLIELSKKNSTGSQDNTSFILMRCK